MIQISNLSKSFSGVPVLNDVNLDISSGEIHALVGANGSGKSTIVRILSGYHTTVDSGVITFQGIVQPLPLGKSRTLGSGISFVHQDLGLVDQMSLIDNVCLYAGYPTDRFGRVDEARAKAISNEVLHQLGLKRAATTLVRDLGPAERVIVAVARATAAREKPGLLVLDEPTAAIPIGDIARIIEVVRSRRDAGWAVLYISHRLDEVLGLADRVSILRDGRLVATRLSDGLNPQELTNLMVGTLPKTMQMEVQPLKAGESKILNATNFAKTYRPLIVTSLHGSRLKEISFTVQPGEVVGITGPAGSGKSELGRILVGATRQISGLISLGDEALNLNHPQDALDAGIASVPQDRARLSLIPKGNIRESISGLRLKDMTRGFRIRRSLESKNAQSWITAFGIVPADEDRAISSLSGGNQQKTVIARALRSATSALVLDDPTAGVDVGARAQIQEIIRSRAVTGLPIVLLSTEIDELISLCDKVLVLRTGQISQTFSSPINSKELASAVFAGNVEVSAVDEVQKNRWRESS